MPFGSNRVDQKFQSYANKKKFTGKELDSESGLYYYGARYYDSDIGRWMGVDPLVLDLQIKHLIDPQKLNAYTYVLNNPLRFVDSEGNEESNPNPLQQAWNWFENTILTPVVRVILAPTKVSPDQPEIESGQYQPVEIQSEFQGALQNTVAISPAKILKFAFSVIDVVQGNKPTYTGDIGSSALRVAKRDTLGQNVQETLKRLEQNGFQRLEGYEGGRTFRNQEGLLPQQKDPGYYTEFDVNPSSSPSERGLERIVRGQGGEIYYTNTHYGKVSNGSNPAFYKINN